MTLLWDDPSVNVDEQITDDDIKNADGMGRPPVGKYLCRCIDSQPEQVEFKAYSCIGAKLKFEIEKPLEIEGKKPTNEDMLRIAGKIITDTVALYSPYEKEGMKNRRILIAKRMGLINAGTTHISTQQWAQDIIDAKVIINFVENKYTDKSGNEKISFRVAFDGYDYADKAIIEEKNSDDFSDI